jgi:hypothetical protein
MARHPAAPGTLGSASARRTLDRLHERPVNFSVTQRPRHGEDGWHVDDYCLPLPSEAPGPPVPGGSWAIGQRVIRDYEFADPRIVRAVYYPEEPLADRDMLLVGRFFGLRFHMGVRVGGVVDEECEVDGRPVRIWGWDYQTLEGHLEAGQMDYEVWKWLDTGAVQFRIRRFVRTTGRGNPVLRLGFRLFGRTMQVLFVRRAFDRMLAFVHAELGHGAPPPRLAADAVRAQRASSRSSRS